MTRKIVAVLWLSKANYDRAVALSEDGMPATYEAWRDKVEKLIRSLPSGIDVVRIEADPDEVAAWCRANGRQVTTENRSAYAAWRASKSSEH